MIHTTNQNNKTLLNSHSSVLNKLNMLLVQLTGHFTLKLTKNVQEAT